MDRILCQLCYTMVRCGEKHSCFFYKSEDFYTITKPQESEKTDKKHNAMLKETHSVSFNDKSATACSNFQKSNVESTSEVTSKTANRQQYSLLSALKRKIKSALIADNCSNTNNSLLDLRENTPETLLNSKNSLKSPPALANTAFPLRKKQLGEFDPKKNIMDTSISTPVDHDSFSANATAKFNNKQSQEFLKNAASAAGVPVIRPRSHTSVDKGKHSCGLGSRQFKDERSFIRRTHTEQKPFECGTCGKQFSDNSHLKIHYRIHTGEKPFECHVCGRKFNHEGNLNYHYRIHTGKKPFKCDVCGKGFTHRGNLKRHHRTHTGEKPFECETCGNRFTQKESLDVHSRTHTGERPFVCDICNEDFANPRSYRKHAKKVHTQETPFKCGVCGKAFKSNDERNQHWKEH